MFIYLLSILTAFLNVLGCYWFFETFGRKKLQSKGKTIRHFIALYFLLYFAEVLPISMVVLKTVILILTGIFVMAPQFAIKKNGSWLIAVWYASKRICLEVLFLWTEDQAVAVVLVYGIWLVELFFFKKKLCRKVGIIFEYDDWKLFVPVPLLCIFSVYYLLYKSVTLEVIYAWDFYLVLLGGNIVFQGFVYGVSRALSLKTIKNIELGMRQQSLEQRVDLRKNIFATAEHQRVRAHDFMNHLLTMNYMAQAKQYEELQKYIASQVSGIRHDATAFDTKNIVINAILNTKYCEARDQGIFVHTEYDNLKALPMEPEDLSVMLGNLLNNAIEAAGACDDEKVIRIKILWKNQELYIYVSNTHRNTLRHEGEIFYTTKKNQPENHGYGIRNIKAVVEKYSGESLIYYDESEFVFEIKIPLLLNKQ